MWGGIILIVIGVVFLLNNLGIITGVTWSVIWPAVLIVLGFSMLNRRHHMCLGGWCGHHSHWKEGDKRE